METVRYYERRGLLPPAPRSSAGHRCYGARDVARLRFIVQAKELGFTLEEIGQLLAISDGGRTCAEVRAVAQAKAAEIGRRVAQLRRIEERLRALAEQCARADGHDPCPILNLLEVHDDE